MIKRINIFIITTLLLIISTLASAQDDQNLASFILRNHEASALPTVGNINAEITIVEFLTFLSDKSLIKNIDKRRILIMKLM